MSPVPTTGSTPRYLFVDLLRGWAVLVMIETHVYNALIASSLREGPLFSVINFVNGLVAPSFLFCAGFALAITLQRRWEEYVGFGRALWRYLARLLLILVVGYSLHLPFFSFQRMRELTSPEGWASFFQSDILQVIAVSLAALVLLALVLRRRASFVTASALLTAGIVLTAPIVRAMDTSSLAPWVRPYLSMSVPSEFPLFPWAGFLTSGACVGYLFQEKKEPDQRTAYIARLSVWSFVAVGIALVAQILPVRIYASQDFWGPSPEFFFIRLGIVVNCLAALWWYERRRQPSPTSVVTVFGQESLLVYVTHLLIVYGQDYEWSLVREFGPSLNYLSCFGIFAALTFAMFILAYSWRRLKLRNIAWSRAVEFAVLGGVVFRFLTK